MWLFQKFLARHRRRSEKNINECLKDQVSKKAKFEEKKGGTPTPITMFNAKSTHSHGSFRTLLGIRCRKQVCSNNDRCIHKIR